MGGTLEQIYLASPVWAQQGAVATYGWWWYRRRFGPHFHRLVTEFKRREHWTAERFREYQKERLRELLAIAWHAPYYREIFAQVGVTEDDQSLDILRLLPFLSKETLRRRGKDLLTQNPAPKGTITFKSSGSTGTPTEIYYSPDFHALEVAVLQARNLNWAGLSYGDRRVMFGARKVCRFDQSKPPFWRFSPAENMAYASIYHLSPVLLPFYLDFLRSYRPALVMGYPSALNAIAAYAISNNDMPFPATAVITTSETVTHATRKRIETAFQCQVYDGYGAVEMCLFTSQCKYGSYHVSPDVGFIEIVDSEGKEVPPGTLGQVICTGLHNTLQPLIRYRIGDVARWSVNQNCPCGRNMPVLEGIEGRFEDICYAQDGREMLRFDTVFKGVHNIREAQVIQEKIDCFAIHVVPEETFNSRDVEAIQYNMRLHIGNVEIHVKPVSSIQRGPSGKFKAVVCKLTPEEKTRIRYSKHNVQDSRRFDN